MLALSLAFSPERALVGDWEPPSSMVVVYNDAWPRTFASLVGAAAVEIPVVVLVEEGHTSAEAREAVETMPPSVVVLDAMVDSSWTRDWGPFQVREADGAIQLLDLPYSDDRPYDDAAPGILAEFLGRSVESFGVSFDGGAIASNGDGLCATTKEFLRKWEISSWQRRKLSKALGCRVLMQLPALSEDATKHVDLFLQFAEPTVAVLASFDETIDPVDAERMDEAAEILEATSAGMGIDLTLIRVPVPSVKWDGYRAYVNFVRLPGRALIPSFHDVPEADEQAAFDALELAMPAADLVRVPADGIRRYGGSLHCIALGMI